MQAAIEWMGKFLAGGPAEDSDINAGSRSPYLNAEVIDDSPPLPKRNDGRLNAPYTSAIGKRIRVVEDMASVKRPKQQGRVDPAQHLFESYDSGTSQRIAIPTQKEDREPQRSSTRSIPGKVWRGGLKIQDTLNEPRFFGGVSSGIRKSTANSTVKARERLSNSTLGSRTRFEVPLAPETIEDDYAGRSDSRSKRQKLVNGNAKPVSVRPKIDLTRDDAPQRTFEYTNSRSAVNKSMIGTPVQASPPMPEQTEASKVFKWLELPTDKPKRRDRRSQGSSENSVRTTPNDNQPQYSSSQKVIRKSPDVVVPVQRPDNEVQIVSASEQKKLNKALRANNVVNDTSTGQSQNDRVGSRLDLHRASEVLNSAARHESGSGGSVPIRAQPNTRRTITRRDEMPELSNTLSYSEEGTDGRLSSKFFRDVSNALQQSRPRVKERMQVASNVSVGRSSLESEDELSGAATILGSGYRQRSPEKATAQYQAPQQASMLRKPSPSNLKPTNFRSSGRHGPKERTSSKQASRSDADIRIRVNCVLCRSCYLIEVDATLVWDIEGKAFYVEHNGVEQKVPGKDQLVCIGLNEAQHWIWTTDHDFLSVHIKGSASSNSNGSIIIGFCDWSGLRTCYKTFREAGGGNLRFEQESIDRMVNIINKQGVEIKKDYERNKATGTLVDHNDQERAAMQIRKRRREIHQPSDEDEIHFEEELSPLPRATRSRFRGSTSNDDRWSPTMPKQFMYQPPAIAKSNERRSSRQIKPSKQESASPPPLVRWTRQNKLEKWSHSVIYPPEGAVRRATVDFQDLERLDEGEFLNDNVISFALRQIEENMAPKHKDNVLFFNSFFYTALTTKSGRKAFNYDAVKRWTKNKDLFSIPYIVVPINIDLHWFVAIICNLPNLLRKTFEDDPDPGDEMLINEIESEDAELQRVSAGADGTGSDTATADAQNSLHDLSISDIDVTSLRQGTRGPNASRPVNTPSRGRPSSSGGKKSAKRGTPRQRTFDPDVPTIVTLDSLGSSHSAAIGFLKQYLNAEAEEKRGMDVRKEDIQGMTAKGIPEQNNFCDCGVYVVAYVEAFAKDPRRFMTKVLQKQLHEHDDFEGFNPSDKRAEIRNDLLELYDQQEADRTAKKLAKRAAPPVNGEVSKGVNVPASERAQPSKNSTVQTKNSNANVAPIPSTAHPLRNTGSGQAEIDFRAFSPQSTDAEANDIETQASKAMETNTQLIPAKDEDKSPSSRTAVAENGQDEMFEDIIGTVSDFGHSHVFGEECGPDLLAHLTDAAEDLPATDKPLNKATVPKQPGHDDLIFGMNDATANKHHARLRKSHEGLDFADEGERGLEVLDSQESERY